MLRVGGKGTKEGKREEKVGAGIGSSDECWTVGRQDTRNAREVLPAWRVDKRWALMAVEVDGISSRTRGRRIKEGESLERREIRGGG